LRHAGLAGGTRERTEQSLIDEGAADRRERAADGGARERRAEQRQPSRKSAPPIAEPAMPSTSVAITSLLKPSS
jgi:hypothetical protein